jgi:hypothetical protein
LYGFRTAFMESSSICEGTLFVARANDAIRPSGVSGGTITPKSEASLDCNTSKPPVQGMAVLTPSNLNAATLGDIWMVRFSTPGRLWWKVIKRIEAGSNGY